MDAGRMANAPNRLTARVEIPAACGGRTPNKVTITLDVNEGRIGIAPNVTYEAWMYGGSVPGPVLRVKQGQTINFTLLICGIAPRMLTGFFGANIRSAGLVTATL